MQRKSNLSGLFLIRVCLLVMIVIVSAIFMNLNGLNFKDLGSKTTLLMVSGAPQSK
jgi:hypothetical protein